MTENDFDWYHAGYMRGLLISMTFFAIFGMIPMILKILYLENKVDRLQQQQAPAKMEAIP